jgi:hypothetical protein
MCWEHRDRIRRVLWVHRPKDGRLRFFDRVPPGFQGVVKYLD